MEIKKILNKCFFKLTFKTKFDCLKLFLSLTFIIFFVESKTFGQTILKQGTYYITISVDNRIVEDRNTCHYNEINSFPTALEETSNTFSFKYRSVSGTGRKDGNDYCNYPNMDWNKPLITMNITIDNSDNKNYGEIKRNISTSPDMNFIIKWNYCDTDKPIAK
ncbi:hypothetical protein [Flammeovirga sp. SJP92]|uniref:hypothetical protein n=1 Tax=Flammeovirga sp. SJP92 TaxID=1775430 RepID=UPI00078941A1|nr:hypothetical protein [Flammeovirga sp. SJP92]KXX67001.1 hypothetical protein AVL50_28930 [Flammeovirga sp. SJP92]